MIAVLDLVLWLVEGSLTFTAPVSGAPTDSACSLPSMLGFAVSSVVNIKLAGLVAVEPS